MLRLLFAVAIFGIALTSAHAGSALVSDYAFVMPDTWFLLPGPSPRADALLFRRYSLATPKTSFDAIRSGKTSQVDIVGPPGTFYNSMIYTCRKTLDKPDYLTFHLPSPIAPASFEYDAHRPELTINIATDKGTIRNVAEYNKGDIFVDASTADAANLLRLMQASEIAVRFGSPKDLLNLSIRDKYGRVELAKAVKATLPIMLKFEPGALRSFSNQELREHCLAYRGAT
jgi:hypothetical protein